MTTKIWACRGASAYAPANTIPAFKLAAEMGADGVTLEVQESADGRLMVIHSPRVDGLCDGQGRVAELSCQALKRLDFGVGREGFGGTRIPTLREVYGLLRPGRMTVNVVIPYDEAPCPGIWSKLLELEREMGMTGRVAYSAYNHYVLMKIRALDPDAEIGLLYTGALVDPWLYAKHLKADALQPGCLAALSSPGLFAGCREAGVPINVWGVEEENAAAELASAGAHAIVTTRPDAMRGAIAR